MKNKNNDWLQCWKKSEESKSKPSSKEEYDFKKCNHHHGPSKCPTYDKKCSEYGKLNNFKVWCRQKQNVIEIRNNVKGRVIIILMLENTYLTLIL